MAITLKQIALTSINASVNYTAADVAAGKVQVVRSVRLVNTHASAAATVNVLVGPTSGEKQISPINLSLAAGQAYQEDFEIVLVQNDHVKVTVGASGGP